MGTKRVGDGGDGGPDRSCSILGHGGEIPDSSVTPEEAEALEKLAEIFADAMLKLEQEHGLTPRQMLEYYKGQLDLKKDTEEV